MRRAPSRTEAGGQVTYSWETTRATRCRARRSTYDRGFRMDTAFLNRVGITRGWQYQAISFYPEKRLPGSSG